MQSQFINNIIDNYQLAHEQEKSQQEIREILKQTGLSLIEFKKIFYLTNSDYIALKNGKQQKCTIRLYSQNEEQQIEEKIIKLFKVLRQINATTVHFIKKMHKISDKKMMKLLNLSKSEYEDFTSNKKTIQYHPKKYPITKQEQKIIEQIKQKEYLYQEDLIQLNKTFTKQKLFHLFQIKENIYYNLLMGKTKRTKLHLINSREKQEGKIKIKKILKSVRYITLQDINQIKQKTKYSEFYIATCLDLNKDSFQKLLNKQKESIELITTEEERKIFMLKMDLKYLKRYGERDYKTEEIKQICKQYKIKRFHFIKHILKNDKLYNYCNRKLQMANAKVYIGEKKQLSHQFIEANYSLFDKEIKRQIYKVIKNKPYGDIVNDLKQEAYVQILEEGGKLETNCMMKDTKLIQLLTRRSRYAMLQFLNNSAKEKGVYEGSTNQNIENILADYQYDPNYLVENNYIM